MAFVVTNDFLSIWQEYLLSSNMCGPNFVTWDPSMEKPGTPQRTGMPQRILWYAERSLIKILFATTGKSRLCCTKLLSPVLTTQIFIQPSQPHKTEIDPWVILPPDFSFHHFSFVQVSDWVLVSVLVLRCLIIPINWRLKLKMGQ